MSLQAGYLVPHPPLIIPEVGKGMEREIDNTVMSYEKVGKQVKEISPDTLIIISPHAPAYADYFQVVGKRKISGSFQEFGADMVQLESDIDLELTSLIIEEGEKRGISLGYKGYREPLDHGTMVPLYFINKEYSYPVVRLSISGFSLEEHYNYGIAIQKAIKKSGKNVVVIISGDLSHNLDKSKASYSKKGEEFDLLVGKTFQTGDFLPLLSLNEKYISEVGECGLRPLVTMMGILDGYDVKGDWMSYEAPFGVGYGIGELKPLGKNPDREYFEKIVNFKKEKIKERRDKESEIVRLARHSLESMVNLGEIEDPKWDLSSNLLEDRSAVFVTLNKDENLRGCIGTLEPTEENIATEIMKNSISAGLKDHRFNPVKQEELEKITYSVDVLGESEIIDSKDKLDVNKYGVIVESGNRRGVLLPNIESVTSVDEQVQIALEKAGINRNEDYILKRFEVNRYF